ncbi:hypothetical protein ABZS61_34390 [Streptomyces sp. NPDC005566]|uniref:hypothetical protein n=1 Tax=Streptomyces sp. NPDC005566 TaxID=3156886 RepID=UPI0033A3C541
MSRIHFRRSWKVARPNISARSAAPWNAARAQTSLGLGGHGVDSERLRAVVRPAATTGLPTRTYPTRATYDTTEQ